jgi:hypothetical protein
MKHSKVFLGITTCLITLAGVAAVKASKFQTAVYGFYRPQTDDACTTLYSKQAYYTMGIMVATAGSGQTIFKTKTTCAHALYIGRGD